MLPSEPLRTTHYDATLKCVHFCREYICGKCDKGQLQEALVQLISPDNVTDPLISALLIIECEESIKDRNAFDSLGRLIDALKDILDVSDVKQYLDIQSLESAKLIPVAETFKQKFIKMKTRMFYKQHKFNLFREESEGFAKLITFVLTMKDRLSSNDISMSSVATLDSECLANACRSLIGTFNIDPNRVFDVILEAMESQPDFFDAFCGLLRALNADPVLLGHVLGFKIESRNLSENLKNRTFEVAALLTAHGLASVQHFLSHLLPPLDLTTGSKRAFDKGSGLMSSDEDDTNLLTFITQLIVVSDQSELSIQLLKNFPSCRGCEYEPLSTAFCSSIEQWIHPLYRLCSPIPISLYENANCFDMCVSKTSIDPPGSFRSHCHRRSINNWQLFNKHVIPVLFLLGQHLSISMSAFLKIIRITSYFLSNQNNCSDSDFPKFVSRLEDVVVKCFLPSLSLLNYNEPASLEVWNCIIHLGFEKRYEIYAKWSQLSVQSTGHLKSSREQVISRARYIFNRITMENVRNYSRQLAKLSYCNPIIVCQYIVDSVLRYDNFIVPVVDALKYLSPLAYDVLIYSVITSMAKPSNQRLKHDGACFSSWLRCLTLFGSSVLRKYPVDCAGIIQHIIRQLDAGHPSDILFLQQILHRMCGIEVVHEMTEHQLGCLSGGVTLFSEGGFYSVSRNVQKSMNRFREYLLSNDFIFKLCIKICQQRDNLPYMKRSQHSKMVGYFYDQCQNTLVQLMNFLRAALSEEEHAKLFPSVTDLLKTHCLGVDHAFMLTYRTHQYKIKQMTTVKSSASTDVSPTMAYRMSLAEEIEALNLSVFCGPRIEILNGSRVASPYDLFCNSPLFFVTFWTCSMYDIQCPIESYEKQRQSLQELINKIEDQRDSEASKFAKEHERYQQLIEQLHKEERDHKEHTDRFLEELDNQKSKWFSKDNKFRAEIITEFLYQCIYPRCLLSELDSLLCARYIYMMHKLKIPEFTTIICYDRIFMNVMLMIASCTECEADRYGRFLGTLLETVMYWHSNRQVYEKECLNNPGFLTSFRYAATETNTFHKEERLTYENYRHVCHKWHYQMIICFIECMESSEYIQIRNSLKVLTRIISHFPKVSGMYNCLEKRVDRIRIAEKDSREDLSTLATVYMGQLRTRRNQMIDEGQFHMKIETSQGSSTASVGGGDLSSTTMTSGSGHNNKKTSATNNNSDANLNINVDAIEESNPSVAVTLKSKNISTESSAPKSSENRRRYCSPPSGHCSDHTRTLDSTFDKAHIGSNGKSSGAIKEGNCKNESRMTPVQGSSSSRLLFDRNESHLAESISVKSSSNEHLSISDERKEHRSPVTSTMKFDRKRADHDPASSDERRRKRLKEELVIRKSPSNYGKTSIDLVKTKSRDSSKMSTPTTSASTPLSTSTEHSSISSSSHHYHNHTRSSRQYQQR